MQASEVAAVDEAQMLLQVQGMCVCWDTAAKGTELSELHPGGYTWPPERAGHSQVRSAADSYKASPEERMRRLHKPLQ